MLDLLFGSIELLCTGGCRRVWNRQLYCIHVGSLCLVLLDLLYPSIELNCTGGCRRPRIAYMQRLYCIHVGSLCLVLDLLFGSIELHCTVVLHGHVQRMEHNDCIGIHVGSLYLVLGLLFGSIELYCTGGCRRALFILVVLHSCWLFVSCAWFIIWLYCIALHCRRALFILA